MMRDIKTIFEQQEKHKPKRVINFCYNTYIEYDSNGNKIEPC